MKLEYLLYKRLEYWPYKLLECFLFQGYRATEVCGNRHPSYGVTKIPDELGCGAPWAHSWYSRETLQVHY